MRTQLGLAMALTVLAVSSCQVAPVSPTLASADSNVNTSTLQAPQVLKPNNGQAATTTGANAPSGADWHAALQGASGVAIKAAQGGVYTSPDGLITMTIPPGALSQDATVKAIPVAGAQTDNIPNYNLGIKYAVDLGGAYLNPDTQIIVRSMVAPNFIANAKLVDPAFSLNKYSLSQDAQGKWMMTMSIPGPSTKSQTAANAPLTAEQYYLQEYGSLPPAPTLAPMKSYSLQCFVDLNAWLATERTGAFTCGQASAAHVDICWSNQATGTGGGTITLGNGTSVAIAGDKIPPPPPPPPPYTINTHTVWQSDDPSVNGNAAAGASIQFSFNSGMDHGITAVSADGSGNASTWARTGTAVTATSMTNIGPAQGTSGSASNGSVIQLRVPKYSPLITVDLKSDSVLSGVAHLSYVLDGTPGTRDVTMPAAAAQDQTVTFYMLVPDDGVHTFAITDASAAGSVANKTTLPVAIGVQRNHVYNESVTMFGNTAK